MSNVFILFALLPLPLQLLSCPPIKFVTHAHTHTDTHTTESIEPCSCMYMFGVEL